MVTIAELQARESQLVLGIQRVSRGLDPNTGLPVSRFNTGRVKSAYIDVAQRELRSVSLQRQTLQVQGQIAEGKISKYAGEKFITTQQGNLQASNRPQASAIKEQQSRLTARERAYQAGVRERNPFSQNERISKGTYAPPSSEVPYKETRTIVAGQPTRVKIDERFYGAQPEKGGVQASKLKGSVEPPAYSIFGFGSSREFARKTEQALKEEEAKSSAFIVGGVGVSEKFYPEYREALQKYRAEQGTTSSSLQGSVQPASYVFDRELIRQGRVPPKRPENFPPYSTEQLALITGNVISDFVGSNLKGAGKILASGYAEARKYSLFEKPTDFDYYQGGKSPYVLTPQKAVSDRDVQNFVLTAGTIGLGASGLAFGRPALRAITGYFTIKSASDAFKNPSPENLVVAGLNIIPTALEVKGYGGYSEGGFSALKEKVAVAERKIIAKYGEGSREVVQFKQEFKRAFYELPRTLKPIKEFSVANVEALQGAPRGAIREFDIEFRKSKPYVIGTGVIPPQTTLRKPPRGVSGDVDVQALIRAGEEKAFAESLARIGNKYGLDAKVNKGQFAGKPKYHVTLGGREFINIGTSTDYFVKTQLPSVSRFYEPKFLAFVTDKSGIRLGNIADQARKKFQKGYLVGNVVQNIEIAKQFGKVSPEYFSKLESQAKGRVKDIVDVKGIVKGTNKFFVEGKFVGEKLPLSKIVKIRLEETRPYQFVQGLSTGGFGKRGQVYLSSASSGSAERELPVRALNLERGSPVSKQAYKITERSGNRGYSLPRYNYQVKPYATRYVVPSRYSTPYSARYSTPYTVKYQTPYKATPYVKPYATTYKTPYPYKAVYNNRYPYKSQYRTPYPYTARYAGRYQTRTNVPIRPPPEIPKVLKLNPETKKQKQPKEIKYTSKRYFAPSIIGVQAGNIYKRTPKKTFGGLEARGAVTTKQRLREIKL